MTPTLKELRVEAHKRAMALLGIAANTRADQLDKKRPKFNIVPSCGGYTYTGLEKPDGKKIYILLLLEDGEGGV